MNPHHQYLLDEFKRMEPVRKDLEFKAKYVGSTHPSYGLSLPQLRKVAKDFMRSHRDVSFADFRDLLDSLFAGKSIEEKLLAGILFGDVHKFRKDFAYSHIYQWFGHLEGWAEVDNLCQSAYSAREVLQDWSDWHEFMQTLYSDKDIHRRRASLVLQVRPARESDDRRIKELVFETVDQLKSEKDILITKAISWLLRSLVDTNKLEVKRYVQANIDNLPKVAVRETLRKIETGRK